MTLLETPEERGYPADYLFARLRARRTTSPARAGEDPWLAGQRERTWVFRRMGAPLRQAFAPYYRHLELRTLLLCLRNLAAGAAARNGPVLAESLLGCRLKERLLADDAPAALAAAEEALTALDPAFRGLAALEAASGSRAFEQAAADRLLRLTLAGPLHPLLRDLFVSLVDLRNLLARHKARRWKFEAPPLLAGGRLGEGAVARLAEAADAEQAFRDGVGRRLRRAGRDPLGVGAVIDYLWRCPGGGAEGEGP